MNMVIGKSNFAKKCHLTEKKWIEGSFIERSSDRKFIWPKTFYKKWSFDRKLFRKIIVWPKASFLKNWNLTEKKSVYGHLNESTFAKKIHTTEKKWVEGCFTERSSDRKHFIKKWLFDQKFFRKMVIWPEGPLTETFFQKNWYLTEKKSIYGHLTESTFAKICHLTEKKWVEGCFTERSSDRKFIWPKGNLTESFL
jgi:hypothetical protein